MKPRLFCEFPAGLAAVSLRLHGGEHCRPPISRMGNKAGYSAVILAALGLRSGGGAAAYWWAEADADVAALLRAYPDAALLQRIAEIIRGWADEEPRALWERLRAERRARGPREDAAGTAGWIVGGQWSYRPGELDSGFNRGRAYDVSTETHHGGGPLTPDSMADACTRLASFATDIAGTAILHRWSFSEKGPAFGYGGPGARTKGYDVDESIGCERTADRFEGMAREVAGFAVASSWSYEQGNLKTGFVGPGERRQNTTATATAFATARLASGGWPPVRVTRSIPTAADVAAALGTPGDLDGVVVYMDPPYVGTTGYAHDLGRDEVVRIAYDFDRLGAIVAISEADIVIPDWHAVEITGGRRGQKRTFSRQQAEWLTINREPAHRVAVQTGLFGGA